MTKKTKRWLKIVIVIIIISILPIANVVSPFLITLPVFGRVTDDITGKPVEGAEVVSGLYKNVFNPVDAASSVEAGEIRVTTGSGGLYFIRPHIALKIPLINYFDSQFVGARTVKGENMDYRYQTDHEVYRNGDFFSPFLLFRMKNFVLMPRIANTKLCTNPGGDYRPDAKLWNSVRITGLQEFSIILLKPVILCRAPLMMKSSGRT